MTSLTTGEVMEALEAARLRIRYAQGQRGVPMSPLGREVWDRELQVLALLEKYAPELVQREAEEASGERMVRPVFTVEEAQALRWPGIADTDRWRAFERASAKLDAALKASESKAEKIS